ncbi:hypothetical protein DSO57_1004313 [Entomophthora muscae]|uniref:Uncharacterized protein n=1 Tax=Entomophthora muscae TaxID=34485 RepID=A0ACC2SKU0_9FUNG|nr:hypothetical protein DSO57_1004313 [Entomophthora muscae]
MRVLIWISLSAIGFAKSTSISTSSSLGKLKNSHSTHQLEYTSELSTPSAFTNSIDSEHKPMTSIEETITETIPAFTMDASHKYTPTSTVLNEIRFNAAFKKLYNHRNSDPSTNSLFRAVFFIISRSASQ